MRRIRLVALLFAAAAMAAISLTVASPASADTLGPFVNLGNGLCIQPEGNSINAGARIVQQPCYTSTGAARNRFQEWDFICVGSSCNVFHVQNHGSLLCLDVKGGAANGTPIIQWPCNTISNENWNFGPNPTGNAGIFSLKSRVSGSNSHCLDVPGASAVIGVAMQLFQCNSSAAQLWTAPAPIIE